MRILLSEGASTSAREAITALGLAGHHVEVCDPGSALPWALFPLRPQISSLPAAGTDPRGYLAFILERISGRQFDVLLPIHEQGLLLAKVQADIRRHVAVALPRFDSYLRAHNKLGFSEVLDRARPAATADARRARRKRADGGETFPDGAEDAGRHRQPGHLDRQG